MGKRFYCPQCGAQQEFRFEHTVQRVCEFCRSILVRRDARIERVGEAADLADFSQIQVGTEGIFKKKAFVVTGRIKYAWEAGAWNEWHLSFQDGSSGWLSDAQAEYAVTQQAQPDEPLPPAERMGTGRAIYSGGLDYEVSSKTLARYEGVEGELPFEYWDKTEVPFVDLRRGTNRFATIDYSEDPPLLFTGERLDLDELKLKNLRQEDAWAARTGLEALNCPSCGASVELRAAGQTVTVACSQCLSVLDASTPGLKLIQKVRDRERVVPLIPLGTLGNFHGTEWETIGFQTREIQVEGVPYEWREYVLLSRKEGFRYLTEYDGHWNWVTPVDEWPNTGSGFGHKTASYRGESYKHFQNARAETTYVFGEFPWVARVGDKAETDDYVHPPRILSSEKTPSETTWSVGEYLPGPLIWNAFKLKGAAPRAQGIFANQPSPHTGRARERWKQFFALAAILVGMAMLSPILMSNRQVFQQRYSARPGATGEQSFVTSEFDLGGRTSNVEIGISTNIENNWAYFDLALIDSRSGQAWNLGREVSYYHGRDSDGNWSEGGRRDSAMLPSIAPGRYYLRVEPDVNAAPSTFSTPAPVEYAITVRRDVTVAWIYFVALVLLAVPPAFSWIRHWGFEASRWRESDYAPSDDGDGDDE